MLHGSVALQHFQCRSILPPTQPVVSEWMEAANCKFRNCRSLMPALDRDVLIGGCNYLSLSHRHSPQFSVPQTKDRGFYCDAACTPRRQKSCTPLAETRSEPQRERHKKKRKRRWGPAGNRNGRRGKGGSVSEKERGCDCQQHVAVITASRFLTCSLQTCLAHVPVLMGCCERLAK